MGSIKINEQIHLKKARTKVQRCLYCYEPMNGAVGVIFGNKGDGLAMKKTLWVHYKCMKAFGELMIKSSKKYKNDVVSLGI